ncbi:uncharacterized protein LOC100117552 isoform X1 [Nasonia vitripennis]|uniref:Uncharacterized protein n=2 Tax=Nasonia vitripennis TaxID=7425 RepID=A0A7M7QGB5_NASVI|nr:uncharacterized protein LOC100117552 isoform X1 [Nasonia vitripennis]
MCIITKSTTWHNNPLRLSSKNHRPAHTSQYTRNQANEPNCLQMQYSTLVLAVVGCCLAVYVSAEESTQQQQLLPITEQDGETHVREKRTLFLKKKLLGAGLLGFGLGAVKGYKLGYHSGPQVHHVYLAPPPPPVKYVEYVEKPVYVPHIVEKPVFKPAHFDHYEPAWSQQDPSPVYGPPSSW